MRGSTLFWALVIASLFFLFIGILPNFSLFIRSFSSGTAGLTFVGLVQGIFTSSHWYGWLTLILVGLLTGINVVIIAQRAHRLKQAGVTGLGSLFGVALSGCVACATGILPLLGLAAGVAALPLRGAELGIISVLILLLALYWNLIEDFYEVGIKHDVGDEHA